MDLDLKIGEDLLVDGPASFEVVRGRAEVLGRVLSEGSRAVVRRGKRLPMTALEECLIRLRLGDFASCLRTEGSIPTSWREAAQTVIRERWSPVMVMGPADSGKSSLCTYLCNRAIREGIRVGVIDEDIGQSDIGPPGTIGLAVVEEGIIDLYDTEPIALMFVGTKTPSTATLSTFRASEALLRRAMDRGVELLIVNTDGWVSGEEARAHKRRLIDIFDPGVVIMIRKGEGIESIDLGDARRLLVDSPSTVKEREPATRREMRNLAYAKYLKGAAIRTLPLLKVERSNGIEERVLVGLEDECGELLGIGVLTDVDETREVIRVQTPVRGSIAKVKVGRIRLERGGEEASCQ